MKRLLINGFCFLLLASACRKDKVDAHAGNGSGKLSLLKGDNQSGLFGEMLKDSIVLKVTSMDPDDYFKVTVEMLQGNGRLERFTNVTRHTYILDTAGVIRFNWQMGCDNNVQKVKFYIYTDSTNSFNRNPNWFYKSPSDSLTITATAVKPDGWCRSCGYGVLDRPSFKIFSKDNSTHFLVNGGLFSSIDGGYNWYKVEGIPYSDDIADAQINSKNWMYILTKTHGIYFSTDLKQWTEINNGILNYSDPTSFLVEDTALFVSFYFDGPYRSTNNGQFWRKMLVHLGSQRFHRINRHPGGKLMLFDDWNDFKVSADNGDTWSPVYIEEKYKPFGVSDFVIDAAGSLYIGGGDATISILDPNTYQGEVHRHYEWNASSQTVNNITITADDVYYLVNHTPKPGIFAKSNNWSLIDIGFNKGVIGYYYLKQNKTFLVGSDGWLYYHH
jgi:hypothetical protein